MKRFRRFYALAFIIALLTGLLIRELSITKFAIVKTTEARRGTNNIVAEETDVQGDKININTASKSLLKSINGIGDKLAERIIKYREENGKFETIEDIMKINGIGDSKFEDIKDYITVE